MCFAPRHAGIYTETGVDQTLHENKGCAGDGRGWVLVRFAVGAYGERGNMPNSEVFDAWLYNASVDTHAQKTLRRQRQLTAALTALEINSPVLVCLAARTPVQRVVGHRRLLSRR